MQGASRQNARGDVRQTFSQFSKFKLNYNVIAKVCPLILLTVFGGLTPSKLSFVSNALTASCPMVFMEPQAPKHLRAVEMVAVSRHHRRNGNIEFIGDLDAETKLIWARTGH